jgi:hypothetical protein
MEENIPKLGKDVDIQIGRRHLKAQINMTRRQSSTS